MHICRARDFVRTPWKNGGGTTAEIVVEPPGASFEQFDWRISMADVSMPGPFSTFSGIDRTLALIEGRSLDLDVDGVVHHLDGASPVLSFRGEAATRAALPDGPIRDLNVMTRRARFRHRMRFLDAQFDLTPSAGAVLVLVAIADECSVALGSRQAMFCRFDVLVADSGTGPVSADRAAIAIDISAI